MIFLHVSELAIDRLLAGELGEADADAVRIHASGCTRCGAALDHAAATRREVSRARTPAWLPRRASFVPYAIASACAAAATLALVLAWPRGDDSGSPSAVRVKGSAIVGYFVAHGDAVRRGAPGEIVFAGDRLALYTTTLEPMWFAATSVDGAGTRSVYVEPRLVEPGRERVLPLSIDLDATLGTEVVTGVFCREPFDPLAPPSGCTIDRFTLVKVPR